MLETSVVVLIAAVIGGGVLGAVIRAWSIQASLASFQSRLQVAETNVEDLRANLLTEIKRRAGEARQAQRRTKDQDQQELAKMLEDQKGAPAGPGAQEAWWWRQQ